MTAAPLVGSTFFGLDISQFAARFLSIRRKISKRVLLVEFGPDSLLLAEATLTQLGVQLSHVSSFSLPPEALDRGVPAEPLKMAGLIQDFCSEKKIPAHRVAVVLPPELAFQRLLDLPASLPTDEAREYVLNPANGLQIPFPLTQTDFDLFPVLTPVEQQAGAKRLYMLTAIPEVLVDPIVEMLQAADLELQLLELGSHSQLRNHAAELITLAPKQVDLVLELLPDCSNLMLVSCSGLLGSERLTSVRNLPQLPLEDEEIAVAVSSGVSVEDLLFKDESYFPLSDLDVRGLADDLRASLERFHLKRPGAEIRRLILTGVNSSHPQLADLLADTLSLPVVLSRSTSVTGLSGLSMDDLLLQSGLGRLTGLALGLLPNDQLLACSLDSHSSDCEASQNQNDAVAIADLLRSSEAQTGLDLVAVEASPVDLLTDETKAYQSNTTNITTVEDMSTREPGLVLKREAAKDVPEESDLLPVSQTRSAESDELNSSLPVSTSLKDESSDIVVDEKPLDSLLQDEWPSIASSVTEHHSDIETSKDAGLLDEQWPSIANLNDGVGDEIPPVMDDFTIDPAASFLNSSPDEDVSRAESLWPSIASTEPTDDVLVEEVVVKVDESECLSITVDPSQEVTPASLPSQDPESPIRNNEYPPQVTDVDLKLTLNNALEQPEFGENPAIEDSVSGIMPTDSMPDHEFQPVIPDLNLTPETVVNDEEKIPQQSALEDSGLTDVLQELGELRFAEED